MQGGSWKAKETGSRGGGGEEDNLLPFAAAAHHGAGPDGFLGGVIQAMGDSQEPV